MQYVFVDDSPLQYDGYTNLRRAIGGPEKAVGGLASAAFHPAGAVLARRHSPKSPENSVAVFAAAGTVGLALGPIAALA